MKPNPTKKPRRPKDLGTDASLRLETRLSSEHLGKYVVDVNNWPYTKASECRKLAQWLVKAADYLEGKDENS